MSLATLDDVERKPLTTIQMKVLVYFLKFVDVNHYQPAMRDICDVRGWSSPQSAASCLLALRRKGWLGRSHGARAIEIPQGTLDWWENQHEWHELLKTAKGTA